MQGDSDDPTVARYGPADSLKSPRFAGVRTFGRLPYLPDCHTDGVDIAVLGVPFDTGGTYRVGARFGPEAVRSASALLRRYNPELDVDVYDELSVADFGDVTVVPGYAEESLERIERALTAIVESGIRTLVIGGDHTITLAELRAIGRRHGAVGLVQFDSHSDTLASYFGVPYTHGTPFWHAATEGWIDPSRSIQVGLRGSVYSRDDLAVPRELGLEVMSAPEVHRLGMAEVNRRIRGRVGDAPVFISFDIDFIDPSHAPGTGTPEVGGFTTWEALQLIRGLVGLDFAGFDVVEVLPQYDVGAITALAAANVGFEFLSLVAAGARDDRRAAEDGKAERVGLTSGEEPRA